MIKAGQTLFLHLEKLVPHKKLETEALHLKN